jgi:hypothetical protein
MKPRLENLQRQLETAAKRWRERADEAPTAALREYYKGRAVGARAAADRLQPFLYSPDDNPYDNR